MTEQKNSPKILVAYATRYNSTKDIAEKINEILRNKGYDCDLINFMDIKDITEYDAIIAGSPIHMGKWLPEARDFMKERINSLMGLPLFVFSAGITLINPTDHVVRKAYFATDEIKQYVDPKEIGLFTGCLVKENLTPSDKDLVTLAKCSEGDFRKYDEVIKWTEMLDSKYLKNLSHK